MGDRQPDFLTLEAARLLTLHFPASEATQGRTILGQFVPVARARRPLRKALKEFGLTLASGTVDGESAEAVIIAATKALIAVAFIPQGLGTLIAIEHGADYGAAYRVAATFFHDKVRPIS